MTSLNPDPLIVALVQAASTLPIRLFAVPAGAPADIFDKRKFLLVVETLTTAVSAVHAVMVGFGLATPGNLLLFTLLIGAAGALTSRPGRPSCRCLFIGGVFEDTAEEGRMVETFLVESSMGTFAPARARHQR
jgi:MFS family permease